MTVAQSRSCSESVVITKSKKYNVITLWLRKIVVILMQYSMLLPFQENLVPHNNKQNKTQSQSSHWIFWTGMPCRGVDYQTKIKILWWNNQTCLNIWPKLWEFFFLWIIFFCHDFTCVAFDTMLVLFVTVIKCKKEQTKKKKQKGFESVISRNWTCMYWWVSLSVVCILSSRSVCYRLTLQLESWLKMNLVL